MAMSSTERQRRRRARLKEAQKLAPDMAEEFVRHSFADFLKGDREAQGNALPLICETLGSVGLDHVDWEKDEDPEWRQYQWHGTTDRMLLGKAERMVGAFVDVARELARLINRFKLQEVDRALAEIERADLSDPAIKKQVLAEVVRLNDLKRALQKEVRYSLPAIAVKGE
jgi:hypothetical protein